MGSPAWRVVPPAHSNRSAALLALIGVLIYAVRNWIALGNGLPLGAAGTPAVVLANKLSGWFHPGERLDRLTWTAVRAHLVWEWLPALFLGAALVLWLRSAPAPRYRRLPGVLVPVCAVGLFGVAAAIAWGCFQCIPHVQDSISQHLQAQIFASGRLTAPVPPHPEFFPYEFMVRQDGRWYAQYPPGQAALLSLGVLAGAPWLVNPLLGALSALLLYGAGRRAYGRQTARLALVLFCLSPFVWFMAGEWMNHGGTLFFLLLALYAGAPVIDGRRVDHPLRAAFFTALFVGLAVSTRPLCGVAAGAPLLLGTLWGVAFPRRCGAGTAGSASAPPDDLRSVWSRLWPVGVVLGLGLALGVCPQLLFNAAATGSPLRSGYEVQWGSTGLGFGQSQWGDPHTFPRGVAHALRNFDGANRYLFEWPVPSLLPLLGFCYFNKRWRRMDRVLFTSLVSLLLAYVPYFFQDLCLGPRYLHAGIPAFALLSARGLTASGAVLGRIRKHTVRQGVATAVRAALLCSAIGLAVNLPPLLRWYGSGFWGTSRELVDLVRARGVHNAVVFIRDYNRARTEVLLLRGVPRWAAHLAVERMEPRWLDTLIRDSDARRSEREEPSLTQQLVEAMYDPAHPHRRKSPLWIDWRGPGTNFNLGSWANSPEMGRQDVIYAVHQDARNVLLLEDFPGRAAWEYDWDATARAFTLRPWRPE